MLAIAAKLNPVAGLLAVVAAVLAERTLGLDSALTGRVSAFRRSSHVEPPLARDAVSGATSFDGRVRVTCGAREARQEDTAN
jgi:hypothetical protein